MISQRISNSINFATDAITRELDEITDKEREELLPLFRDYLPETIARIAFEDVHNKVPEQYTKNAIASCLASKLVYKEGCNFIDSLPKDKLARVAMKYISKEKEMAMLKSALIDSDMDDTERNAILQILENGGVLTSLKMYEESPQNISPAVSMAYNA